MAIDNNSTVAISIRVSDDGSISLLDVAEQKLVKLQNVSVGAGSSVGKLASNLGLAGANLGVFGTSIQSTTQGMAGFSNAAIKAAQDTEEASKATQKLHGNMREVSGTARELGLNMGYSMRRFLAESPAVMAGLKAMSGAFIALSAIDIGVEVVEGVAKLYEKWFDVNKEVETYQLKAQESAELKLFDTGSLETEISLLKQAQDEVDRLDQKKHAVGADEPGGGFFQTFQGIRPSGHSFAEGFSGAMENNAPLPRYTGLNDEQNAQAQKDRDTALERTQVLNSQFAEQRLKGEAEYDSTALKGYDAINAKQRDGIALAQQHLAFTKQEEQSLQKISEDKYALQKARGVPEEERVKVYRADPNAGNAEYDATVNQLAQQAAGQRVAMARQENDQIIQMRNAAMDAGIRGEALYAEQAQQAEDAIRKKISDSTISRKDGLAEIQALDMKFHNEKMQRLQDEDHATQLMQEDAQGAGLTGIPKLEHDRQSALNKVEYDANQGDFQNPETVARRRASIDQQTNQDILDAHKQFQQEMDQITQRSDQAQLAGYARIEAEAKGMLARIAEDYKKTYGQLADDNPAKIVGTQQAQAAITGVIENAQRERLQYSRQVNEQIAQTEAEAARAYLPPWQAAQAQILDQYQQRVQKAKAALDQQAIDQQQYDREIVADSALAQAQISRQMEQTRDQVAGQLEQMFSNPAKYMENRAKQMMMDIVANWVTQLMQANPQMQGLMGGLLGMNKMGTSANPIDAMKGMFGAHADGGNTLMSAGSTLSSSGTMLAGSAARLSSSATALMQAASMFSSSSTGTSTGGGAGQIGQLTDLVTGAAGTSTGAAIGGGFGGGATFASGIGSLPGTGGGLSGALSVANTVGSAAGVGGPMGAATGIAGTAGSIAQMTGLFSGSTQMLNPDGAGGFGGLQATDLPPTNSAGVLGTVPDSPTGTGGFSDDGSGITAGQGMGMAMAGLSTGIGLYQAWNSGNALGATLTGAMGGASIGMMAGGPLGAGIGAGIGALVGFLGSLFSDHGLSKAKHYNTDVVLPGIQKEMNSFTGGGGGYDQASQDLNNLMVQAQQQCKSFGSAALSYYNSTIVGEITAAQAQIDRMSEGGRANVTMSTAQFDSGGVVTSFGDMSTGPFSGFVHMSLGERVMNPMASMIHGPVLDAMNSGSAALATMRRSAPLVGGGGAAGGDLHLHISAIDAKSFHHWARSGGAGWIQSALNEHTSRYAGKALY